MTVSSSTARVSYSGNGSTKAFAVNFYFLSDSHLKVILRAADGTETVKTLATDYTVTGAANPAGGTVTMVVAPASGQTLVILRNVPNTQETDYQANDPFPAESHERALDKLTMIAQQQATEIAGVVKFPATDATTLTVTLPPSSVRANKLVKFDASGNIGVTTENYDADLHTVAGIASDVSAVAAIDSDVTAVASNATNINTVAGSITNVNAVGSNIAAVVAVDGNKTNINAVNANKTNIDTVAGNNANVTTVAGISSNVTTVAGISANVTAVASNATNINAVAGNATNINAVNANKTNIDAVAGNATNINAVNANKANIDINAANIVDIQNAEENAQIVMSALNEVTDGVRDRFVAGVDYTKNTTSQLTLSNTPLKGETVKVFFSGVYQEKTTWTRTGAVVQFTSPIPVDSVEITYDIGRSFAELDAAVASASGYATTASNHASTAVTKANDASASASAAATSASGASASAASAAGSAASAAQIVYGNLITHPNIITESLTIPDGYNAFFIDPVEFGPNVTITGLGNSTLRGV